LKIATESEHYM